MNIPAIITWVQTNWQSILTLLAMIYGIMAFIVKICPTIPDKGIWHYFLALVKILGKITHNQTNDAAVRAAQ